MDWDRWSRWTARVAYGMTTSRPRERDDLIQVGLIAAWQADESYDGSRGTARDSWIKFKIIGAMRQYITRLRAPLPTDDALELADRPSSHDASLAYHHAEILAAVGELTKSQQKYVYLRFWVGLNHEEMRPYFGYVPNALWSSKKNGARWKLAGKLAHLAQV